MGPAIVSDASCLIGLSNSGKVELLPQLFSRILIPPAVEREFGGRAAFAECIAPTDRALVTSLGLSLGAGESEAIALAVEHKLRFILDDRKARTVAEAPGLQCIGAVGILLRAKQEQLIPNLTAALHELEATGFYISDVVKQQALKLAGEKL